MNISALPQLIKMIKTKDVKSLNIKREYLLLIGVLFYLSYGIHYNLKVVMFSNIWACGIFLSYIFVYHKYKKVGCNGIRR